MANSPQNRLQYAALFVGDLVSRGLAILAWLVLAAIGLGAAYVVLRGGYIVMQKALQALGV